MPALEPEVLLYWFVERPNGTDLQITVNSDRTAQIFCLAHVPKLLGRRLHPFESLSYSLGGLGEVSRRIYHECSVTVTIPDEVWAIVATAAHLSDIAPNDDMPIMTDEDDAIVCAFAKKAWSDWVRE